ncbi:arginine--tRNA ligase [Glaciecola sp. 1036]|uniref:arginine--tRNA ligase n=1 Tax=Alteromonadaceae TaxID=72275 RepID=UPI003D086934
MLLHNLLVERFQQAMVKLGVENAPTPISKSTKAEFGDYQFNGAMGLAKQLKKNPREIAQQIVEAVDLIGIAEKCEIAGPGFINIHLSATWLASQVQLANQSNRLEIAKQNIETIVVDYSSPNLAKEMHVGHLRSTIIGDAVVRILEFLGHNVIRQNHMGDWGTQFGMLLAHLSDKLANNEVASTALSDLEDFYREAKVRFDEEDGFADRAREYVVKLQSGDPQCLSLWEKFIDISVSHSEEVYEKLKVTLSRKDIMGESAYNDMLKPLVDDLIARKIAQEDQGAKVVFLPELADKEGKPAVYIIQKSGGGFLYSTTDLAAIKYRCGELQADRTLIFTDARQALHFKQTEIVARKADLMPEQHQYQHCPFGMMLGKDGKPFKTRTGGTVKLSDLLDEAVDRAAKLMAQRDLAQQDAEDIAKKVGIGAVKYSDLSKNRTTDYVFDWDTMLSFEGNTAPYLQYAYTRISSIFRKANEDLVSYNAEISLQNASEKALAVKLLQLEETLITVSKDATPHVLCNYLYELATLFMRFYEDSPILKDGVAETDKQSRLTLAAITAKTVKLGLDMLGIDVLDKM